MMSLDETGGAIIGTVITVAIILIGVSVVSGFILHTKNADTRASLDRLVSVINSLDDWNSTTIKISMDRGAAIMGFSKNSPTILKHATGVLGIVHISHSVKSVDHPNTGVCPPDSTCLCAASSRFFKPSYCLALNDTINTIFYDNSKKGNMKINLGVPVKGRKGLTYLVLATTLMRSYHMLLNITKNNGEVLIYVQELKGT